MIWSSPLLRATKTAEIIKGSIGIDIKIIPSLAERNFGNWEGMPKAGIDRTKTPPRGEPLLVFYSRVEQAFKHICLFEDFPLVVAHSGIFQALYAMQLAENTAPQIKNASPVDIFIPLDFSLKSARKTQP